MKLILLLFFSSVSYAELQALDDLGEYRIAVQKSVGTELDPSAVINDTLELRPSTQGQTAIPKPTVIPEIGSNESVTRETGHTHFVPAFQVEFQSLSNSNF